MENVTSVLPVKLLKNMHAHEIQKADCSSACPDWSERSHPTANEKNEMANVKRCNISLKKENSNALALALRN